MSLEHSITVTAMNRPHLFRRLLDSLMANDLDGWRIVIRVEPSERSDEFAVIAKEVLTGVEYDLEVNQRLKGIDLNPFDAVDAAFSAGSKLNLYLEEDLIVSPDTTALALWYERNYELGWFCLSLLAGPCGSAGFLSNQAHPDLLFRARTFNSIGFAMRREEWHIYARPAWLGTKGPRPEILHANWRYDWGWDWSLYGAVAANPSLRSIQPVLARATHTGRLGGLHTSVEFHDAAFGKLPINKLSQVEYHLTDIEQLPQDVRSHATLQDELTEMRLVMEDVALGVASDADKDPGTSPGSGGLWKILRRAWP